MRLCLPKIPPVARFTCSTPAKRIRASRHRHWNVKYDPLHYGPGPSNVRGRIRGMFVDVMADRQVPI
jgi:hypothetical protein